MSNKLIVNQVIPFSNVDGIGNRYALFLQGCNIECVYCHNPETMKNCNHCGDCIEVCRNKALKLIDGKVVYNKALCINCNACIYRCTFNSSPKIQALSVDELFEDIKSYQNFIRGITISGGEPTLQKDLIIDLFNKVKELGLTCYIDTNGFFNKEQIEPLIEVTDKFLFDVKTITDSGRLCKVDNLSSLDNLSYLLELTKIEEVRTVIVNSYMDARDTVNKVSQILRNYSEVRYKLIRVHEIGLKQSQKDLLRGLIPTEQEIMDLVQLARENGVSNIHYVL